MNGLTLQQARALCDAALAEGRRVGAPPLAVAVLDARASIKALHAEDSLGIAMPQIAVGKANAVLALNMDGAEIASVAKQLPGAMAGFSQLLTPFIAVEGAVLIRVGDVVAGSIGVTGDSAINDEAYARAAVAIVFSTGRSA